MTARHHAPTVSGRRPRAPRGAQRGSRLGLALAGLLLVLALPAKGQASEVLIEIDQLRNADGTVLIAVCDKASFLTPVCPYYGRTLVQENGRASMLFRDVTPGFYAVQVIHDEDADDEFDMVLGTVPTEGYGFSNNPEFMMGPPDFEEAAVQVNGDSLSIPVTLQYLFD